MKLLFVAVLVLLSVPATVGSVAGAVARAPQAAPQVALFPWVPTGGFPNSFPFGQCTWWAASNHPVSWWGNAGDWLVNARAQGISAAAAPSVGAIAVYWPGGDYDPSYGHVAIVTAVSATNYTVSEMNAIGWGKVSTRVLAWPDPQAQGFIPATGGTTRR